MDMDKPFEIEELIKVVLQIDDNGSPGLDIYNAKFYKTH